MKFNQAQLTSAIKGTANFVAGILTTHGMAKAASIVNAEDTVGVLVFIGVWVYSHFFQHTDENEATPTPLPQSKGGGVLPPVVGMFLIFGVSCLMLVGCATDFGTSVFNSEKLMADGARQATHSFNLYASFATNGADAKDIDDIEKARQQLYEADKDLYRGLTVVDNLRLAYATNASATNKQAIIIGLQVISSQSSNITSLTKSLIQAPVK